MDSNKYDLIVVGGGILGTFHAYHALLKGLRVLQLEKDNYPVSSTVRNFGQVVPSGMAGRWFDYGVRGLEIYKSIQNEMDISVRNNGSMYIASDPDEVQMLHELSAHYQLVDYAHELWCKEQVLEAYPMMHASYVKEAIIFKQEVSVEPDLMIHRLHHYMQSKFDQYTLKYNKTVIACEDKTDTVNVTSSDLGTFHAYHALLKGLRVLQLEKDNYPVSSTVRNFGQVVPSGMAGRWFDYGVRGLEIYKSIQNEMDISVRNNGSMYIASDPDEVQMLHELSAHYQLVDYAHELWCKEQVLEAYPMMHASYVKEAIIFKQEVSVEPDLMIHRLHHYMQSKFDQYTLKYNKTVIACEDKTDTVNVTSSDNQVFYTDKVIICNGYEFKILYRSLFENSGLKISKLQMMRTKPLKSMHLPGNILTGLTIRRYESFEAYCPSFLQVVVPEHYHELRKQGIHILFKQAVDGSIIIGDSHEYASGSQLDELGFSIHATINDLMLNEANRILPVDHTMIASSWAGFYAQHENEILELDISDRIHVRTGIGGKGMTASAGYAEASIAKIFG